MKLWLDDVRTCPFIGSDWLIAKNFEQAVIIMQEKEIEEAWLDHDLAPEHSFYVEGRESTEKTGYDFVLWMKENNKWPSKICMVHSANPVGSKRMCEDIAQHYVTYVQDPMRHYIPFSRIESFLKGKIRPV